RRARLRCADPAGAGGARAGDRLSRYRYRGRAGRAAVARAVTDASVLVRALRDPASTAALDTEGWTTLLAIARAEQLIGSLAHRLIHRDRDGMIDVHHTILPLTARITPDAEGLIADSELLENGLPILQWRLDHSEPSISGLSILRPEDMVIHAAAHLIADGDLA